MFETHDRKTPERISTVIFDLDDTLIDSLPARVEALQEVFSIAGISVAADRFFEATQGGPIWAALQRLEGESGRPLGLVEKFRRAYWLNEMKAINLYPGVEHILNALHTAKLALGVVTQKGRAFELDGKRVGAQQELLQLGVGHLFSAVVGLEDVKKPKPDPEGMRLALGQLGALPRETLVVGDSSADIEAANAAGCWSCLAAWGVSENVSESVQKKADFIAKFPEIVLRLTGGVTGH